MRRAPILLVAAALAGCGLGAGSERDGAAELRVTRDFGQVPLRAAKKPDVREGDTVMRFLRSRAKVETRYGGRFVQAIDGLSGTTAGEKRDWFYYVNGIEAPTGATERKLEPGDVVHWDYRRWDAAARVPAIVGSFPEPFVHGAEGKRFPTRIECADRDAPACDEVARRLSAANIAAGFGSPGAQAQGKVLRVMVGRWLELRDLASLEVVEQGPQASGVFARFRVGRLELLDDGGRLVRTLGAGAGLLAAIMPKDQQPVWLVTGVDEAGVEAAAGLLAARPLRNAYAVAATPSGPVKLPVR